MRGRLTINLTAIMHNYALLQKEAKNTHVAAVIKANAYGLGAAQIAPALYAAGCRFYFVAYLEEALILRQILKEDSQIAVLNAMPSGCEKEYAYQNILPVLNDVSAIQSWSAFCAHEKKRHKAILHIDTGMQRLGLTVSEAQQLSQAPHLQVPYLFVHADIVAIMTHLTDGENEKSPANFLQKKRFEEAIQNLPKTPLSLANSGGIFLDSSYHYQIVRAGLALYGFDPRGLSSSQLQPSLCLEAPVLRVYNLNIGDKIGYNGTFTAHKPMQTATISLGYADGWPRSLSNKGCAYFKGQKLPIIGTISMDSLILDISEAKHAPQSGDYVEFIGPHQSLHSVARAANTITYEILTSLNDRFERIYRT